MSMYEKSGGMTEEEAIRFNKYWIAGTGVWVMGAVMAQLKPQLQGRADVGAVSKLEKQRLAVG